MMGWMSWRCCSLNGSRCADRKSAEAQLEEGPQTWSVLVKREEEGQEGEVRSERDQGVVRGLRERGGCWVSDQCCL